MKEYLEKFLIYLEIEKGSSPNTVRNYGFWIKRFIELSGVESPADINLENVQKFRVSLSRVIDKRTGMPLSKHTQDLHIRALRSFLRYLIKNDHSTLPAEKIDSIKLPERHTSFLSAEEVSGMISAIDISSFEGLRDRAIVFTFFSCGLRISELAMLKTNQVNLKSNEFEVLGKGGRRRTVFLTETTSLVIEEYLKLREDRNPFLFVRNSKRRKPGNRFYTYNPDTEPVTHLSRQQITNIIRKDAKKAGIGKRVTPHSLRHSFATDLLTNGADIRAVQELLGHKNLATTQIYTHLTKTHLREIHKRFKS
jgi:site-specific recombinase XerD